MSDPDRGMKSIESRTPVRGPSVHQWLCAHDTRRDGSSSVISAEARWPTGPGRSGTAVRAAGRTPRTAAAPSLASSPQRSARPAHTPAILRLFLGLLNAVVAMLFMISRSGHFRHHRGARSSALEYSTATSRSRSGCRSCMRTMPNRRSRPCSRRSRPPWVRQSEHG